MLTSLLQGHALLRIQHHSSLQESSCKLCISGVGGEGSFALYHPPLLHNLQAEMSADGSELTAVFQAMCAGVPAQTLFDTGADNNVIDHAFAQRVGIHVDSTSTSQVQLADASAVLATGVITSTLHIQDYQGILRCHAARLDLPCDLIVGESWMRNTEHLSRMALKVPGQ